MNRLVAGRIRVPAIVATIVGVLSASGALAQSGFESGAIIFPHGGGQAVAQQGPGLFWVVSALAEADVRVGDPELERALRDWLASHDRADHVWLLSPNTAWSLPDVLFSDLDMFDLRRVTTFSRRPDRESITSNVEFRFNYRKRPASAGIARVVIHVWTEAAAELDESATTLALDAVSSGVAVSAHVAPNEIATDSDRGIVTHALRDAAVEVWTVATANGVAIGGTPGEGLFTRAETAIHAKFTLERPAVATALGRPEPIAQFKEEAPIGTGRWSLHVKRVRLIRDVRFEVPLISVDEKNGTASEIEGRRRRAAQRKAAVETAVTARLRSQFDAIRNTVPTVERLRGALSALDADPALMPDAAVQFDRTTVVFRSTDRRVRFGFDAALAGGWSAEDGLFGSGSFSGDNLLRMSDEVKHRAETESMTFTGLAEVQRVDATWQVANLSPATPGQTTVASAFLVSAQAARDRDQLFGNALNTRIGFESSRLTAAYRIDFASAIRRTDGQRASALFNWTGSVGPTLAWGRVSREEGFSGDPKVVTSGRYAGVVLAQTAGVSFAPTAPGRPGVGDVRVAVDVRATYAPAWLDFGFHRVDVGIDAQMKFGAPSSFDYVVRYRTGIATASDSAPLFELPRLGGAAEVRGLEDGEQIGSRLGYVQLSAGPSLERVLTWFGREPSPAGGGGKLPLADTYLTGFIDRGAVDARASISQLLWPGSVTGYGAAVEIHSLSLGTKRARLTIGYGRSPDSLRHTHGIVVTSVAVDLN